MVFTSSVWFNLLKEAKRQKIKFKKNQGILVRGGVMEKMYDLRSRHNNKFKKEIKNVFGTEASV